MYLLFAVIVLVVIVFTSLKVGSLYAKAAIFLTLFGLTAGYLNWHNEETREIFHHVFLVDYPQFIMIPLVAVTIAVLNLFHIQMPDTTKLGWLLLVIFPLTGNFGTT